MTANLCSGPSNSHKPTVTLLIDKLTLLINLDPNDNINHGPYLTEDLVKSFVETITDTHQQTQYGITRAYGRGYSGYQVSIQGYAPSANGVGWTKKSAYLIQVGPKKPGHPTIRIDINPEGLTKIGFQYFWDRMVGAPFFLDPAWLTAARVSRLDVAVDLNDIAMMNWVFDLPARRNREMFMAKEDIQTLYLGAKKDRPVTVYNKARQAHLPAGTERTRVECRLRHPCTVGDLGDLANPFKDLLIYDPRRPQMPYGEQAKNAALMAGQDRGRRGILRMFPKTEHKKVLAALENCGAPWWHATAIWKTWASILATTLPGLWSPKGLAPVTTSQKLAA